jgi:hypothetical protein
VAVVEHGGKTYYHQTYDPTYVPTPGTKKAEKHAVAKAKEDRKALIMEARNMLENNTDAMPNSLTSTIGTAKTKLLEGLDIAAYRLSWSVRNARSKKNANALRNYRRKRTNLKKLHARLSSGILSSDAPPHYNDEEYLHPVNEPYILSPSQWITRPRRKKELVRQAIMNEFWTRTLKRVATFPGCDPSIDNELNHFNPSVLVSACHIMAGNDKNENKFDVLSNEVPAPRSNDMQRQLQQLQYHLRTLQQQVHGREPPSQHGGTSGHHAPLQQQVHGREPLSQHGGTSRQHAPM